MIAIKMELYRPGLVIPAKIWIPAANKYLVAPTVFDTGASMSCISEEAAENAGYEIDVKNKTKVTTGGGTINAYYTIIPDLKLAEISIGPILAHVIKFPEELQISALLGLNVIKEFSINMDFIKDKDTDKTIVSINMEPKFDITKLCKIEDFNAKDREQRFGDMFVIR